MPPRSPALAKAVWAAVRRVNMSAWLSSHWMDFPAPVNWSGWPRQSTQMYVSPGAEFMSDFISVFIFLFRLIVLPSGSSGRRSQSPRMGTECGITPKPSGIFQHANQSLYGLRAVRQRGHWCGFRSAARSRFDFCALRCARQVSSFRFCSNGLNISYFHARFSRVRPDGLRRVRACWYLVSYPRANLFDAFSLGFLKMRFLKV